MRTALRVVLLVSVAAAWRVEGVARAALPLPVPISPPTFEIEGRTVRGEVAAWEAAGNEVERADGGWPRTGDVSLQRRGRRACVFRACGADFKITFRYA